MPGTGGGRVRPESNYSFIREILPILPIDPFFGGGGGEGGEGARTRRPEMHEMSTRDVPRRGRFSFVDLLFYFVSTFAAFERDDECRDLFQLFPALKQCVSAARAARLIFLPDDRLEISSSRQTEPCDRRAFHYIRRYYLKRKMMFFFFFFHFLFQPLAYCVSQTYRHPFFFAPALRETCNTLCN